MLSKRVILTARRGRTSLRKLWRPPPLGGTSPLASLNFLPSHEGILFALRHLASLTRPSPSSAAGEFLWNAITEDVNAGQAFICSVQSHLDLVGRLDHRWPRVNPGGRICPSDPSVRRPTLEPTFTSQSDSTSFQPCVRLGDAMSASMTFGSRYLLVMHTTHVDSMLSM